MNCTHCTAHLNDYVDGQLTEEEIRALEAHLAGCTACRGEFKRLREVMANTAELRKEILPARDLWPDLAAKLVEVEAGAEGVGRREMATESAAVLPGPGASKWLRWLLPFAVAAVVTLLGTFGARGPAKSDAGPAWSVAALAGAPRVDTARVRNAAPFRVGQWLETDAASRAKVTVAAIGEVTLDPNSRLRLVSATATDHRLELARGSLHAFIWAPPRLFFVDTPSATAVDLGCAYTLNVAENGDGELHVTSGYVALEHGDRESIIPAGARCLTRRGAGPGTPFVDDAGETLRDALERFDFHRGAARSALATILANARAEDAVTLWHLLGRTEGADREAVFEILAKYHPPQSGVTRAGILTGDHAMRHAWGADLGLGTFGNR